MSKGGKETLIMSILQTLPSYAMYVFLLPLEITTDIERSLTKFWWSTEGDSKISWMCKDRMAKHKDAGGLGFRDFRDFNITMLGKQGWRFLANRVSLVSRLYKEKYFPDVNFLQPILGHSPSFIWGSIFAAKDVVLVG